MLIIKAHLGDGSMHLQPVAVEGDMELLTTGHMAVAAEVGGDVRMTSYGSIVGAVAAEGDILWLGAMDGIIGSFTADGDINEVVSYSGIMANISAANIHHIRTWGDIGSAAHAITASNAIDEVYAGGEITATIDAPTVGTVGRCFSAEFTIDR